MSASNLQFTTCDFGAAAGPVPALLESMSQPPEHNARMPLISITTSLAHVLSCITPPASGKYIINLISFKISSVPSKHVEANIGLVTAKLTDL